MLKLFAAVTLGVALLFGAVGPASAGKGRHFWVGKYPTPYAYSYSAQSPKYRNYDSGYARRSQPNIRLDLETESVWRNLRPSWFD
jgi:hypothetical protein